MPWLTQVDTNGNAVKSWELGKDPVVFGRDDDIKATIEDIEMSRHHFEVKAAGDSHVLNDLNSTNGTWLNGRRVTQAYLKANDRIQAGRTHFTYQIGTSTLLGFVEHAAGTTFKDELKDIYTGKTKKR